MRTETGRPFFGGHDIRDGSTMADILARAAHYIDNGVYEGASDPRKDGCAIGI